MDVILRGSVSKEITIKNESDLKDFAYKFVKSSLKGKIILLSGELGAGKTTFVRFFCEACSVYESIASPSYVLENIYHGKIENKDVLISHWDVYRLQMCPQELFEEDYSNSIVFVEWGDKFQELIDEADIILKFQIQKNNERKINIIEK